MMISRETTHCVHVVLLGTRRETTFGINRKVNIVEIITL